MTTASVFTGVMLSNESRKKLLDLFQDTFGCLYHQMKARHMIIRFRGSPGKISASLMGEMVSFRLVGVLQADGDQVAKVELLGDLRQMEEEFGSIPHVTVSMKRGIKSTTSKQVLKKHKTKAPKEDLVLQGQIGFLHDRHGWVFTHLSEEEMVPTPRT